MPTKPAVRSANEASMAVMTTLPASRATVEYKAAANARVSPVMAMKKRLQA